MNLKQLVSHTVDLDLLPRRCKVLDVGCRDWDFADAVLRKMPDAFLYGLDPGPGVGTHLNTIFERKALVALPRKTARLFTGSTGHADFLSDLPAYADMVPVEVECVTMAELCKAIRFWDCVKLDCEGSEFDILNHWPGPVAQQISVEFHDWDKPGIRDDPTFYRQLFAYLGQFGYRVVQHELSKQGNGTGHWDSLLALE